MGNCQRTFKLSVSTHLSKSNDPTKSSKILLRKYLRSYKEVGIQVLSRPHKLSVEITFNLLEVKVLGLQRQYIFIHAKHVLQEFVSFDVLSEMSFNLAFNECQTLTHFLILLSLVLQIMHFFSGVRSLRKFWTRQ